MTELTPAFNGTAVLVLLTVLCGASLLCCGEPRAGRTPVPVDDGSRPA